MSMNIFNQAWSSSSNYRYPFSPKGDMGLIAWPNAVHYTFSDVEQTMRPNLPINIKAWIQIGPLITYEGSVQGLGFPKSLLV